MINNISDIFLENVTIFKLEEGFQLKAKVLNC